MKNKNLAGNRHTGNNWGAWNEAHKGGKGKGKGLNSNELKSATASFNAVGKTKQEKLYGFSGKAHGSMNTADGVKLYRKSETGTPAKHQDVPQGLADGSMNGWSNKRGRAEQADFARHEKKMNKAQAKSDAYELKLDRQAKKKKAKRK